MATLSFSCPKCGKLHERVNSGMVGFKVKCKCGFVFRLGSKADKNEDFGEVIRKKKAMKRRAAEAAASARAKIGTPTFDLLPKFDPSDPNREDVASPSNEIQSPVVSEPESPLDDSGSMELDDFPLPPPIPSELSHLIEPNQRAAAVEPKDDFSEPAATQIGQAVAVGFEQQDISISGNTGAARAIPDDLLADLEADQVEVQPELPPANGVIRQPSKVVKGRHEPIRKNSKKGKTADGSGSVLWSCIGLGLSVIFGIAYFVKFIFNAIALYGVSSMRVEGAEAEVEAVMGFFAWSVMLDTCVTTILGMSLLFTGVAALFELGKSKLYQWPWIIQGCLAGLALVWGCVQCGIAWQAGSFWGVAITFFLAALAPLLVMFNSLARLILR